MKTAVISDIHGNLEAFDRVLEDIDALGAERIVCLGDNIGYGPEPEKVVRLIRERRIPCVLGNHELAATKTEYLSWFNVLAQRSLLSTRALLSPESLEYCQNLPHRLVIDSGLFVHGCPPDSALRYIIEVRESELGRMLEDMKEDICFVGHTHLLHLFCHERRRLVEIPLESGGYFLEPGKKYLVNVGSVGQPRDPINNNAKYVVWDDRDRTLTVRFVEYDIAVTANKILDMGWPEFLATRLW